MQSYHRDTIIVAILAFACGVIFVLFHVFPFATVYAFLGKEWAYGWASAVATAGVGFAANKISKTAHKAKEQDGYLQRVREYESDSVRWAKLRSGVVGCRLAYATYEIFLAKNPALVPGPAPHVGAYRAILISLRKCLPGSRISSTDVPVSDELHIDLEALDMGINLLIAGIDEFLRENQDSAAIPNARQIAEFSRLISAASEVRDLADGVGDRVDDLRPNPPEKG